MEKPINKIPKFPIRLEIFVQLAVDNTYKIKPIKPIPKNTFSFPVIYFTLFYFIIYITVI